MQQVYQTIFKDSKTHMMIHITFTIVMEFLHLIMI